MWIFSFVFALSAFVAGTFYGKSLEQKAIAEIVKLEDGLQNRWTMILERVKKAL